MQQTHREFRHRDHTEESFGSMTVIRMVEVRREVYAVQFEIFDCGWFVLRNCEATQTVLYNRIDRKEKGSSPVFYNASEVPNGLKILHRLKFLHWLKIGSVLRPTFRLSPVLIQ